jgi:hypothetical protein
MLSRRTQELLERITGNPAIGKGKKLVIGDGAPHLEADTVAFIKSLTEPVKSDLVKSHLAGRRMASVTKRAAIFGVDPHELAPSVGKLPGDRTTPGLGDPGTDTARFLVGLTPAEITRLVVEQYATIRENMGRRISVGE